MSNVLLRYGRIARRGRSFHRFPQRCKRIHARADMCAAVSRALDLREELLRKGNECPLANVDEKWRLIARLAGPEGLDLDYADRRGVPELFDLRRRVDTHDQTSA
jgi:hypothetical protein